MFASGRVDSAFDKYRCREAGQISRRLVGRDRLHATKVSNRIPPDNKKPVPAIAGTGSDKDELHV